MAWGRWAANRSAGTTGVGDAEYAGSSIGVSVEVAPSPEAGTSVGGGTGAGNPKGRRETILGNRSPSRIGPRARRKHRRLLPQFRQ